MSNPLSSAGISPTIPATQEQLIRVMQDPMYAATVGIPQFKAMIMLKEMQQKPPAQPATQTVAQQLASATEAMKSKPLNLGLGSIHSTTEPAPSTELASGGVAHLPVGDHMFQEHNYAGGGIVAFSGKTGSDVQADDDNLIGVAPNIDIPSEKLQADPYRFGQYANPNLNASVAQLVPRLKEKTLDDIKMESSAAQEAFGVDPDFYKKQSDKFAKREQDLENDKEDAKNMFYTNLGFGMAAGTSPFFAVNTGNAGVQATKQLGTDMNLIKQRKSLIQASEDKLAEAHDAQMRGDAQGALKAINDRQALNAQIDEVNAKLKTEADIANVKANATNGLKAADLRAKIYKEANQDFVNAFPPGSFETQFHHDDGFYQWAKRNYLTSAENYISGGEKPVIPTGGQLEAMYNTYKAQVNPNGANTSALPSNSDSPAANAPEAKPAAATNPKISTDIESYRNPKTGLYELAGGTYRKVGNQFELVANHKHPGAPARPGTAPAPNLEDEDEE